MGRRVVALISLFLVAPIPVLAQATSQERADRLAGSPAGGVAGKVMNEQGGPLAGAKVVLRRGEFLESSRTDEKGEYCFCRVAPARDYVLEIELEGFTSVLERDFSVSRSRISIRNAILDSLADFRPSAGAPSP